MQIVVTLSEREYVLMKTFLESGMGNDAMRKICNGTILPKGHGRLIDADAFERRCMFDSEIEDMQDVIYALRDYKPIIGADKGAK